MKKVFSIVLPAVLVAFLMQSCTQPKVDTAREWATIDSLAQIRVASYSDSLKMVCMNNVMVLAQARADSMMTAALKKAAPGTKPKPKPVETKPAPKPGGLSGLSDQNSGEGLKGLSDQKKAEENKKGTGGLKSLSDSAKKANPKL